MSSYITITLDTTAPTLDASLSEDQDTGIATLTLSSSSDVDQVKVWGDIDATWPGNSNYGETEGAAPWFDYSTPLQLRLTGAKRVRVKVRDDVWNESSTAQLQIASPEEETPPAAYTPGGRTPSRRRSKVRVIHTVSRLILVTRWATYTAGVKERVGLTLSREEGVSTRTQNDHQVFVASASRIGVRSEDEIGVVLAGTEEVARRLEGPKTEAALLDLDII